nr:PDZ domain-containing protein [Planctomycetota bacterium]
LPGPDEGWFGGSLSSVDAWVPGGGILVSSLVAGEPADRSGVRDGDWVHTWAGQPVQDLPVFMQLVAASEPGRSVPVGIWRDGRRVLTQFTAGRRPAGQGRLVNQAPLWADAQGRVLVPGRTGLAWIDPAGRTRADHWRWREPGVVRRCEVIGGRACVLINRGIRPDLVVAVDLEEGRELWRVEVQGNVTWMEAVGSALWIHTLSPGSALVVDRRDGRPRGLFRTFDRHRGEFRKNWEPDREADVACGRGFLVSGDDRVHVLRILNTTTCTVEHTDAWEYRRGLRVREYVNPQVAAGPFVCANRGGRVRLYFPDPLGGAPRHVLDLGAKDVLSNQTQFGAVDRDARLYVRGRTLYVVRLPIQGRRNVNVAVFAIDHEALGRRAPTNRSGAGRVLHMRTSTRLMSGPAYPRRYVLSVRARCEGLLVSAARLTGEHQAETWWVASMDEDGAPDNVRARLLERQMVDARRHPPVLSGDVLLVPTDEGALVHAVRRSR